MAYTPLHSGFQVGSSKGRQLWETEGGRTKPEDYIAKTEEGSLSPIFVAIHSASMSFHDHSFCRVGASTLNWASVTCCITFPPPAPSDLGGWYSLPVVDSPWGAHHPLSTACKIPSLSFPQLNSENVICLFFWGGGGAGILANTGEWLNRVAFSYIVL